MTVLMVLLFVLPAVASLAAVLWITCAGQRSVERRVRWVRSTVAVAARDGRLR